MNEYVGTTFLVVKGGDSKSIGSEFESLPDDTRRIFLTLICCLICTACLKRPPDNANKVPRYQHGLIKMLLCRYKNLFLLHIKTAKLSMNANAKHFLLGYVKRQFWCQNYNNTTTSFAHQWTNWHLLFNFNPHKSWSKPLKNYRLILVTWNVYSVRFTLR